MLNKKHIITVVLIAAFLAVIYLSSNRTQHGDQAKWLKEHGEITERRGDPDEFCLDCHNKKFGQTKENFCNSCHSRNGIEPVK